MWTPTKKPILYFTCLANGGPIESSFAIKDGIVIVGPSISNIKWNHEAASRTTQPRNVEMHSAPENISCLKSSFLLIREQGRPFLRLTPWKLHDVENVCSLFQKIHVRMEVMLRVRIQTLAFFLVPY